MTRANDRMAKIFVQKLVPKNPEASPTLQIDAQIAGGTGHDLGEAKGADG